MNQVEGTSFYQSGHYNDRWDQESKIMLTCQHVSNYNREMQTSVQQNYWIDGKLSNKCLKKS